MSPAVMQGQHGTRSPAWVLDRQVTRDMIAVYRSQSHCSAPICEPVVDHHCQAGVAHAT